jgi:hypothetical protein
MINMPWFIGLKPHSSFIGKLAPEITTVSNPNKNPDNATTMDQKIDLSLTLPKLGYYLISVNCNSISKNKV